jgi:hypothetical protein
MTLIEAINYMVAFFKSISRRVDSQSFIMCVWKLNFSILMVVEARIV